MKQAISLLLALALCLSLCACGGKPVEKPTDSTQSQSPESSSIGTAIPTVPSETVAPVVRTEPRLPGNYPNNILMRQTFRTNSASDDGRSDAVFGNSEIAHQDIISVTFLDTLSGMSDSAWDVSEAQNGSVMAWLENGADLYIAGEGGVTASNCARMFSGFINMTDIHFNNCFYTELSKDMRKMFYRCWNLRELDVSCFSTPVMEDTSGMFFNCTVKNLDLSSFDTSRVVDMSDMFSNCTELTELNISSFDTTGVTNMSQMFLGCSSLPILDLRHFDTSNVENFGSMFYGCHTLRRIYLSSLNTGKANSLHTMFYDCAMLTSLDLSSFSTSNVTSMMGMFRNCSNLHTLDLSGFDCSNVKDAREMFAGCKALKDIHCTITMPKGCETDNMYQGSGLE